MSEQLPSPIETPDTLLCIFRYCEPLQLCHTIACVCRSWRQLAKHKSLWHHHCSSLWQGKLYILSQAINARVCSPLSAFKLSFIDQRRNVITFDELTSIAWKFKAKYRSSHIAPNESISCRFAKDRSLQVPPIGSFHWRLASDMNHGRYRYSYQDHLLRDTNPGWFGYRNCYKTKKGNRLKLKFQSLQKSKVTTSVRSGIQGLRRRWIRSSKKKEGAKDESNDENKDVTAKAVRGRYIVVDQYPPLVVLRNEEHWGYTLENNWVVFTSW